MRTFAINKQIGTSRICDVSLSRREFCGAQTRPRFATLCIPPTMTRQTLDVEIDEMLMMAMLLGQFLQHQISLLRDAKTADAAAQARTRIDIASRLRGKLPIEVEYGEPDDEQ